VLVWVPAGSTGCFRWMTVRVESPSMPTYTAGDQYWCYAMASNARSPPALHTPQAVPSGGCFKLLRLLSEAADQMTLPNLQPVKVPRQQWLLIPKLQAICRRALPCC